MKLFSPETLIPLLSLHTWLLLWALPALVLYGYLADKAVFDGGGRVRSERFGWPDFTIAAVLVLLFSGLVLQNVLAPPPSEPARVPDTSAMVLGIVYSEVVFLGMVAGFLASMKLRGMRLREAFGVDRLGPGAVLGAGVLLILMAFPLIAETLELSRVVLAGFGYRNENPQDMVRFLVENHSPVARGAVAFSALVLAPFQEEMIFRGYLYGVARRYLGPAVGIVATSLLFAAIHLHAPSFGGLFVLAVCLALAYEWSGNILVPMTMHALFNSITVINLLAGGSAEG